MSKLVQLKDTDGNVFPKTIDKYITTKTVKTNKILDGKPVYRSYIEISHPSPGDNTYTHNLNIDKIVSIDASGTVAGQTLSSHGYRQIPMVNTTNGYEFYINSIRTNTIVTTAVGWSRNMLFLWIEYTTR